MKLAASKKKNKKPALSHWAAGLLAIILFGIISGPGAANGETILRIHGSNTIGAELMPALALAFFESKGYQLAARKPGDKENETFIVGAKDNTLYQIEIQAHGSSTSFRGLKAGICDIGMASRRIKPKEKDALASLGDMRSIRNEHILGIDGIAIIVNPKNPVRELDMASLSRIFTGKIKNWKTVGGKKAPIRIYARDNDSGTFDTLKSLILKKRPLASRAKRFKSNADLSRAVSRDPNGIGFVGMPFVLKAKALGIKASAGSPGIQGNLLTLAREEYPLSRRLYLYAPADAKNPLVKEFLAFCLENQAQNLVSIHGFGKLAMNLDFDNKGNGARFKKKGHNRQYKAETAGASRLNFNFHFAESGGLDSRSQNDLERLVRFIQRPAQKYYELALIGVNACRGADQLVETVVKKSNGHPFFLPPKAICMDAVRSPGGKLVKPMVEVWLRSVDDGA